ncbi:outer membrane protein assembly factor BamB family protein [Aliidongia dinghuensis]|uniref:outer membrane protein assembly factor BamB family protein n=1 Tax=Aliidongia dinghuensis TaxID=1867774 RepID=UPI001665D321|nr:PQQ-like beta-propeller repeat protein [Aliidongia dinghuensis]
MLSVKKLTVLLVLPLALAACDTFGKKKKDPIPGERISVLALEKQLEPDPDLASLQVELPRPAVNQNWPQASGVPAHVMEHPALSDSLKEAWQADVGEGASRYAEVLAGPVVADGVVYAKDSKSQVTAFRAADGKQQWQVDVAPEDNDGQAWGGGISYDGGKLFVTTGYGQVVALNAADGKEAWRTNLGIPMREAPTIADGHVLVVDVDNEIFALNEATGEKQWTYAGIPETAELAGGSSPAVENGTVVVPFSSGELVALRIENGRTVWQDSLAATRRFDAISTLADIHGRPVIDRGRVIAVSHSGRVASIDLRTGERAWEQEVGGTYTPWVAGDFIYLLSTGGEVICLTRADGRVRWLTQLDQWEDMEDKSGPIHWAGPILAGDRLIVVASNGQAWSLSPYTGKALGRIDLPEGSFLSPVVADNTLYLMTNDGQLTALR